MARQSISFTKPNDDWLKMQVDNKEYTSKSEVVNDLIRQARKQQVHIDWIRAKLEMSEKSGFIVGYTSNGVPYGLTHEEWEEINSKTKIEKTDNGYTDIPF